MCGDALTIADYCACSILYVAVSPKVAGETGSRRPSASGRHADSPPSPPPLSSSDGLHGPVVLMVDTPTVCPSGSSDHSTWIYTAPVHASISFVAVVLRVDLP